MRAAPDQDPSLIAGFYAAAAHHARWPDVCGDLCDAFDAGSGLLFQRQDSSDAAELPARIGWLAEARPLADSQAMQLYPFAHAGVTVTGFTAEPGQALLAPRDLQRDEIYTEFSRRHVAGAFHVVCAPLALDGASIAGLALHRPREAQPFAQADHAALGVLSNHLAAALRLERLLDEARHTSALRGAILDQLAHGAVVTDAAGTVRYANDAAAGLTRHGGLRPPRDGAPLRCENPAETATLYRLIAAAAQRGAGGTARVTRPGRRPILAVTVSALPLALADSLDPARQTEGLVLLAIRDLGATSDAGAAQLITLFGLTGAEAAIIPQMVAGETARQIAQSRGVAQATVRDQANRILAKTGAANLRALTAMVSAFGCG